MCSAGVAADSTAVGCVGKLEVTRARLPELKLLCRQRLKESLSCNFYPQKYHEDGSLHITNEETSLLMIHGGHVVDEVNHAVAVAPLIVVP